jgi:hypothetical protein
MALGGVGMEGNKTLSEITGQVGLVIVGLVLLLLITGLWACLWVPPSPFS